MIQWSTLQFRSRGVRGEDPDTSYYYIIIVRIWHLRILIKVPII